MVKEKMIMKQVSNIICVLFVIVALIVNYTSYTAAQSSNHFLDPATVSSSPVDIVKNILQQAPNFERKLDNYQSIASELNKSLSE